MPVVTSLVFDVTHESQAHREICTVTLMSFICMTHALQCQSVGQLTTLGPDCNISTIGLMSMKFGIIMTLVIP